MAILEHASGDLVFLTQDTLIGRSQRCTLRVHDEHVSRVHALLWWDGEAWILKDLGSDNGTYLDGSKLAGGSHAALQAGTRIMLGHEAVAWSVVDVDPPVMASPLLDRPWSGDGQPPQEITACGGLLALPPPSEGEHGEAPKVTLFRDVDGRWVAEGSAKPLSDGDIVVAGSARYAISLPQPSTRTKPLNGFVGHSVAEVELQLVPSRDFEQIELRVKLLGQSVSKSFGSHKHNDLLFVLAEARARDPEGWVDDGELVRKAGLESRERLNTEVYRARRQFAGLGLSNPGQIIERRLQTKKSRLGSVRRVIIERPAAES